MKHILLNNIEHKDLRVATNHSARFGDNNYFGLVVPSEFSMVLNHYPIFIQKDSNTGKFFFAALFGFQEGENLFLDNSGWNSDYIPLSCLRHPFLIGQQVQMENGDKVLKRVINIDMDNPRVAAAEGERLFTDAGAPTDYLNNIADILEDLHEGFLAAEQLIDQLLAYNLLESFTLKVNFNEYKKYELPGFYTINETALAALSDEKVVALYRNGNMEKIFAILHSHTRVSALMSLKSQQDLM